MQNTALDLEIKSERPKYDSAKHYLGPLCKRAHDAGDGRSWRHNGHGNCVECTRQGAREWREKHPDRARENTRRRDVVRNRGGRRAMHPISAHLGNVARRAREKGWAFDLKPDDLRRMWIAQGGRCYWTGLEMDFYVGGDRHALRPSIDRQDPALGYTRGNVVWASNLANRARGDLSVEEFAEILDRLGIKRPN